ncbi:MAG: sugar ABC transporter permease [Alphaproteobacteria bacterium]|nr:sugar ABC transporter permease [Alphaproteobacteria bacterium]
MRIAARQPAFHRLFRRSPPPSLRQVDARRAAPGTLFVFLAPALFIYAAFILYPVLRTFYNSVHTIKPHNLEGFVGFANFAALLRTDPVFWKAVGNTAIFAIIATIADVAGGLLLALCLFSRAPFAKLLRVVWFTPVLMSYVVVGIIWVWIYDFDWGLANTLLRWVGLGAFEQSWLGDPRTALWSVMATHIWKWLGFNMIIFLAALYALPSEVLGAAELDNCGWLAKLVYIIVPMLRPTIVNLLVLSFIGKMMIFDLVWIMTGGGPLWSTETVSTYVYKRAFDWNTFDLGYPSAIAVLWFVIILAFVVLMTRLLRQRDKLEF